MMKCGSNWGFARSPASTVSFFDQSERQANSFPKTPPIGSSEPVQLPLLGKIAAGTPIEALSDPTRHLDVPATMTGAGDHFALEIVGDSMIEEGILDGDTVVIQRADNAEHGEIVVALVKQQEATLKTLIKEPGRVGLKAANPRYETRYFNNGEVQVSSGPGPSHRPHSQLLAPWFFEPQHNILLASPFHATMRCGGEAT